MTMDHMFGQGQSMRGFSSWPGSKGFGERIFNSYTTSRDGNEVPLIWNMQHQHITYDMFVALVV